MKDELQYQLVLDEKRQVLATIDHTGDILDGKASVFLLAGILLMGVACGLFSAETGSRFVLLAGGVGAAAAVGIALKVLGPSTHILPGAAGEDAWDRMYQDYLYKGELECYDQVLSDYLNAIRKGMARNKVKAGWLSLGSILLAASAVGLLLAILF